jgi:hypothetical protein
MNGGAGPEREMAGIAQRSDHALCCKVTAERRKDSGTEIYHSPLALENNLNEQGPYW